MIQKRIIIKNRVQEVGYRVFLTDIAFEVGIEYFNARNIDGEKVEVLVGGKKENIERFVDMVKREKPAIAENPNIISEDDYDKEIPSIDTYYKRLAMQQFSKGIDAIYRLGDRVENIGKKMDKHFERMDGHFNMMDKHFERMGDRFDRMDKHFDNMNNHFDRMDKHFERMDGSLEALPKRIANALKDLLKAR